MLEQEEFGEDQDGVQEVRGEEIGHCDVDCVGEGEKVLEEGGGGGEA
jgi:hypothetical protein